MLFRTEYLKLGTDLPGLARDFGCRLSPQDCRDALILALAMDQIDDRIDTLPLLADRMAVYGEVLDYLRHGDGDFSARPQGYRFALTEIRRAALRVGVLEAFIETADCLMQLGEEIRAEPSPRRYAILAEREGDLTVGMLFLILSRAQPSERFRRFLRQSGMIGHMLDKLIDLDEDRRAGCRVSPGAWVFILPVVLRSAVEVPFLHPSPFALARWTWSYFVFGVRYLTRLEPALKPWSPATDGAACDCGSPAEPSSR